MSSATETVEQPRKDERLLEIRQELECGGCLGREAAGWLLEELEAVCAREAEYKGILKTMVEEG